MPANPDYEYVYDYEYDENFTIPEYYDLEHEIQLINLISDLFDWIDTAKFVFSIIALTLHIPHFIVLSHREMRNTSVNVIMIGVAFCDILIMTQSAYQYITDIIDITNPCISPESYSAVMFLLISEILANNFLRVSPWLGLMTALIRLLVISFPLNGRISSLSKRRAGVQVVITLFLISSLISLFNYSKLAIVKDGRWYPPKDCGFPKGYYEVQYTTVIGRKIFFSSSTAYRIEFIIKGASNVIPAIFYPVLAVCLILRFWKIKKDRAKYQGLWNDQKSQNTTKLVILMTITFFLSQLPFGITFWLQLYYQNNPVISRFLEFETVFNTILFTISASFHVIVFIAMSSQYRGVAKEIFICCPRRSNQIAVAPVAPESYNGA